MNCPICHAPLKGEAHCPNCGQAITYEGINLNNQLTYEVPAEIKKWNWGAFNFNAFWGIGNKTYLPLLCFIPYFNFIWAFVCGFKGNEWAWKSGKYTPNDIEKFLTIQNTWNRGGLARFIFSMVITIIVFILYGFLFAALLGILG